MAEDLTAFNAEMDVAKHAIAGYIDANGKPKVMWRGGFWERHALISQLHMMLAALGAQIMTFPGEDRGAAVVKIEDQASTAPPEEPTL